MNTLTEGPLCARSGRSVRVAFDPKCRRSVISRP
jgi:hypothetical protein